jgi:hypothetical protein
VPATDSSVANRTARMRAFIARLSKIAAGYGQQSEFCHLSG